MVYTIRTLVKLSTQMFSATFLKLTKLFFCHEPFHFISNTRPVVVGDFFVRYLSELNLVKLSHNTFHKEVRDSCVTQSAFELNIGTLRSGWIEEQVGRGGGR